VPKPSGKEKKTTSATMERVCEGLQEAFEKVASNKGAAGPDGRSVDEVRAHLPHLLPLLASSLLDGTYKPGEIRRVWIPKAGGGQRGLGIPDVIDRMVQEAVRRVLEPLYEPTFHPSSHGFRPGRSCHTAIQEAKGSRTQLPTVLWGQGPQPPTLCEPAASSVRSWPIIPVKVGRTRGPSSV
jgi:retron-type reverse transcriptase